ncbi:MAG TPA: asparagine synthase (glutamine-hydrolyzing), partial [Victivallales bacterium]|nr:asparagine synthase (glutamine-hydrolyzing) [Victivallales bacterium]
MCGIAGIFNTEKKDRLNDIHSMTLRISHRGPDAWGYLVTTPGEKAYFTYNSVVPDKKAKLYFGHRRLSIIDIEGAKQPLSNEDFSIWVVFNGEIYNYIELSEFLKKRGHLFKTTGDTEVLLHLWEEYRENMLHHLVGMFAFALYDANRDFLFLARDRFGQKPLFYAEREGDFFFASELQAFWGLKEFSDVSINKTAIAQYFRYGFIAAPLTAYQGIYSLPAGHWISAINERKILKQYWKPNVCGTKEADLEKIKSLIAESVKIRMRSDVPIGAFLSGGIDSSLITSYMVEQSVNPVKTFTVSSGVEYIEDESVVASEIAKILNTEHIEIRVKPDFLTVADKLARHYGQPFSDHSAVMTYYVSEGARQYVKVALTGDGGDELFAGYTGYLKLNFYRFFGSLPFELKK